MSRVQVLDGFTAYGIAVKHGFHGTEEEWLESLHANGNVHPVAADESMTIPVGLDDAGRLYSGKDPDVDRLKSDLSDKLPKSPANWEPWTAEEQAAALDRMGIDKPFELIETFTIDTDGVGKVTRDVTPDGAPYNFESMMVRVTSFDTNMSGLLRAVFAHRTDADEHKFDSKYTAILSSAAFNDTFLFCDKRNGIWIASNILSHTNGVARGYYAQPDLINVDKNTITGVNLYFSSSNFIVGTEIKIYGVRA